MEGRNILFLVKAMTSSDSRLWSQDEGKPPELPVIKEYLLRVTYNIIKQLITIGDVSV